MRILSLDMATKTGWAAHSDKLFDRIVSGVQVFDVKRGESAGMRFLRFRAWLNEVNSLIGGAELIVYEQAHHRGGAATQVGVGLQTEMLAFAASVKAETMPVHTGTLKKWATGSGAAGKPEMVKAATAYGHEPQDDNEADALLLLYYAIKTLG